MSKNPHSDYLFTKVDRQEMPVPDTGIFDSPYYVKVVNRDWFVHISGIVQGLCEHSAWIGLDDDIKRAMDEIHAFLAKDWQVIENCEQVNDCINNTSPTIKNMYKTVMQIQNQQITQINQGARYDTYINSTVINQAKSVNSQNTNNSASQNTQTSINHLCVALNWFVDEFVARMLDALEMAIPNIEFADNYATALKEISLATVAGSPSTAPFAPLVAIVGGAIVDWFNLSVENAQDMHDAFSDSIAVENVKCCMLEYMNLRNLSYANYLTMLQQDCYDAGSHDETIAYWIYTYCQWDWLHAYLLDLIGQSKLCTITDNCACILPDTCTGSTQSYYPSAVTSYTIPDSRIVTSSGITITSANVGTNSYLMSQGQYIDIDIVDPQCINRISYSCREGASGAGTASANFYINGELVGSGIDLASVSGATENQNKSVFNTGSGSRKGAVLRLEYVPNASVTRQIQIYNIKVGYLHD